MRILKIFLKFSISIMNETGMQNMPGNIIFYTLGRGGGAVG
jgi:hypothetical protein